MTMKPKNFLIIGGTGFIGSALTDRLLKAGERVTVVHNGASVKRADCEHLLIDVTSEQQVEKLFAENEFSHIVNCAGYVCHNSFTSGGKKIIDEHLTSLFYQFKHLTKSKLQSYINIGSADEYPDTTSEAKESQREEPRTPYAFSKVASAHFLQMLHKSEGLPTKTARVFLTYGPRQARNRFVPNAIISGLRNGRIETSEGYQIRDFCFIDDLVSGLILASESEAMNGLVFNIGSGKGVQIREVARRLGELMGVPVVYGAVEQKPNEIPKQVADISQMKGLLDWEPRTTLDLGLEKTLRYFDAH